MRRRLNLWLAGLALAGLGLANVPPLYAETAATFELTVPSAYLHAAAALASPRTYSAFQGQSFSIVARTADSIWLALGYTAASQGTWILASYGLVRGDLSAVPVFVGGPLVVDSAEAPPAATPAMAPASAVVVRRKLTITISSTYVRLAPDWDSTRIASYFKGAVVDITGRDAFGNWLHLDSGGWVPAGVGQLDGGVLNLPVEGSVGGALPTMAAVPVAPMPPWIPVLTAEIKQLYAGAGQHGRLANVFAVAGDCNSDAPIYMDLIGNGLYGSPAERKYLKPTWQRFRRSAFRASQAVNGGFNSGSVLDPTWANPSQCLAGESPYACELRVSRASIIFIQLGTGDQFQWQNFEGNYRRLIEYALASHVVPVVLTKADQLEYQEGGAPVNYINDITRRLAAEYGVPLLDFDMAASTLDRHGLAPEPTHDFHLSSDGVGLHVLATMQTLYVLTQR